MIIYPGAFLLTAAATATPLSHARIGYQTWLRDLDPASISATSTAFEAPADAPLRPDTAEYWAPTALPAVWEANLGTGRDVDYVGIGGHTIGSSGCSALVETSPDGTTWSALGGAILPPDDAPLLFLDETRACSRVRLTLGTGSVMPKIASIYAGVALAMEMGLAGGHTPINLARKTVLHQSLSRGGQFLAQGIRRMGVGGSASFRGLGVQWYRTYFDPFVKAARTHPFFFAWDPQNFPRDVAYAWTPDDIAPSYMGVDHYMQVQFSMSGIGYAE